MAKITHNGNPVETYGDLPAVGTRAPVFTLTGTNLADASLDDYTDKTVVLNISPSIDTSICANSVRRFNEEAGDREDVVVLYISADLPFAHARFCAADGIDNVLPLSVFRSPGFGKDYGVLMTSGKLKGLLSRAVVIIDPEGTVIYTEQVPEIAQDPDFDAALAVIAG